MMNAVKQKRSSFRIDDILSIKTQQEEDEDDSEQEELNANDIREEPMYTDDEDEDGNDDDDIDVGNDHMDYIPTQNELLMSKVRSDRLNNNERGFNKCYGSGDVTMDDQCEKEIDLSIKRHHESKSESIEYRLYGSECINNKSDSLDKHSETNSKDIDSTTTSPFISNISKLHSRLESNLSEDSINRKIYPLAPKATKLPTSLESLMKTHRHDYFLQQFSGLSQKLGSWPGLFSSRNDLLVGLPPGLGGISSHFHSSLSPLSPGRSDKNCICGSPSCMERGDMVQAHMDGPHNFLRPANSQNSSHHDHMSVSIPLPVYVRTRESSSLDGSMKPKKCRRSRTVFSELQLMGLEKRFETQKYLSTPDRLDLAETLGLTQLQVKTWYQNRRMKWKKVVMQDGGTEPPTKPKGRPRKDSLYPDNSSPCSSTESGVECGTF